METAIVKAACAIGAGIATVSYTHLVSSIVLAALYLIFADTILAMLDVYKRQP